VSGVPLRPAVVAVAVATGVLGGIQRNVRLLQELLGGGPVLREQAHADAGRDVSAHTGDEEIAAQRLAHRHGDRLGRAPRVLVAVPIAYEDEELVAALA